MEDPTYLTSLALTEEHFGSDSSGSAPEPEVGPRVRATLVDGEWVLDGAKRWITNANVSRMAFVLARTDDRVAWRGGCSLFLVPTATPGYRTGRVEDKMGIRMNPNAEILLEGCRVPEGNLLGEVGQGMRFLARMGRGGKVKTATKALGIARAAYGEALAYARERVQGGRPIVEHQAISSQLVDMEAAIEATRAFVWHTASCVDQGLDRAPRMESPAKAFASETAMTVAKLATEIHGAYGIQRGRRIEKLMRDAVAILHTGVGNHALRADPGAALASPGGRA